MAGRAKVGNGVDPVWWNPKVDGEIDVATPVGIDKRIHTPVSLAGTGRFITEFGQVDSLSSDP